MFEGNSHGLTRADKMVGNNPYEILSWEWFGNWNGKNKLLLLSVDDL
jgi:hypothetical protein